jgi:hypothetical protein
VLVWFVLPLLFRPAPTPPPGEPRRDRDRTEAVPTGGAVGGGAR